MNIVLTGIPRSGTTLCCSLLNKLPQCIALHEPINPRECIRQDYPDGYLAKIFSFFQQQRTRLLDDGLAVSKAREGRVPDNSFASTAAAAGLRPSTVTNQVVHFEKELQPDFRLVIKHPNMFTATLPALVTQYPCYALVRNPLAVLLSWHSVQATLNAGRIPVGEAFDTKFRDQLDAESDRLNRQLLILEWCFRHYKTHLPASHVIRYENLISTGGRCLDVIDPCAISLEEPLTNRNRSRHYDASIVDQLAESLLNNDSIFAGFYTGHDIENLRQAWSSLL